MNNKETIELVAIFLGGSLIIVVIGFILSYIYK